MLTELYRDRNVNPYSVAASLLLSIVIFFYLFFVGSLLRVSIFPLSERVVYYSFFEGSVISHHLDGIVIGAAFLSWIVLSLHRTRQRSALISGGLGLSVFILYVLQSQIDTLVVPDGIAMASLPVITGLVALDRFYYQRKSMLLLISNSSKMMPVFLAGMIIIVSIFAFFDLYQGFSSGKPLLQGYDEPDAHHIFAYDIFLLLSSLSPVLMSILLLCVPVKLLLVNFTSILGLRKHFVKYTVKPKITEKKKRIFLISVVMALSIFIAILPHVPDIFSGKDEIKNNPDQSQQVGNNNNNMNNNGSSTAGSDNDIISSSTPSKIGIDTPYYVMWIQHMEESFSIGSQSKNNNKNNLFSGIMSDGNYQFFYRAFNIENGGDRPVTLLLIYSIYKIVNSTLFYTIDYIPVLLAPFLVLVVYLLSRELTSNDHVSLLAAFLTSVSFQTTIGLYAGFYANWLALGFGYLSFMYLVKFLKENDARAQNRNMTGRRNLAGFSILLLLTLFSHVYTWNIMVIVMGIFLGLLLLLIRFNKFIINRRNVLICLLVVFISVGVDIGRAWLTDSSGGIEKDIKITNDLVGLEQFGARWDNLKYTITSFVAGQFSNCIILGLGLYWLSRSRMSGHLSSFIIIFLSLGVIAFLFGEWVVQTRILYNIPFQIPAAIGMYFILEKHKLNSFAYNKSLIVSALSIWLVIITFISLYNF